MMQETEGGITATPGFRASGIHCGIKKTGGLDLALIVSDQPCGVAALFTRNRIAAAPIQLCRRSLRRHIGRAIIINSGNANAFTGKQGDQDAYAMVVSTAQTLKVPVSSVFVASTGVIAEPLPIGILLSAIPKLAGQLSPRGGHDAAKAIMTTDTFPKEIALTGRVGRHTIHIGGMAKGSGMIHPDMATMLAFLTTDVAMPAFLLQDALRVATERSFHCITVDGETSTNDMVLCLANGAAGVEIRAPGTSYRQFVSLLSEACLRLAQMIVKDGEGSTKFIEITVSGTRNDKAARKIAMTIARSPLVKTAFFGEDANWGRIVAAMGNAGVPLTPNKIDIAIGKIKLVEQGEGLGAVAEAQVSALLKDPQISVDIHLHQGPGHATVWTSDLSADYIKINASYRT